MAYLDRHTTWSSNTAGARVVFAHPAMPRSLILYVNPNQITWDYGLNTANFPTYGGEVVQILSMFFDDMTIAGEVRGYHDIERIYRWFARYIQIATQGSQGEGSYDVRPVNFYYPERGWHFKIYPKAMPGFRLGRDVVVPSYTIKAAVAEPDDSFKSNLLSEAQFNAAHKDEFDTFGTATAAIGFREDNPFSGPTSDVFKKPETLKEGNKELADWFNNLIPAYLKSDFSDSEPVSKPPDWINKIPGIKQVTSKDGK